MIRSARFLIAGTRFLIVGTRFLIVGARFVIIGARFLIAGARYLIAGARYLIAGARFAITGPRRAIPCPRSGLDVVVACNSGLPTGLRSASAGDSAHPRAARGPLAAPYLSTPPDRLVVKGRAAGVSNACQTPMSNAYVKRLPSALRQ
ncbi:MAG TPA: hypothetical protein VHE78_03815 [Gemmatimonadaceae bacterium]|nr:hypothetical protein [Gemmatimonadaceae bacterium]